MTGVWLPAFCIILIINAIEKMWFQTPWKKKEGWNLLFCN